MQKRFATALLSTLIATAVMHGAEAEGFSNKGTWKKDAIYKGKYEIQQGDTVQWGDFNGQPLYWRTKFWTQGDEPGMFGVQGGTNPWVLINTSSYDPQNPGKKYEWTGWNGQLENSMSAGDAVVPTWRNGAEGAYTIIHDDIGAMTWEDHILPGLEVNRKYPDIKVSWGVYVEKSDETEWQQMRMMVLEGHEMTSHSMNHTSAAEQWQWTMQDSIVPWTDPSIPEAIRGLKVVGFPMPDYTDKAGAGDITLENDLVTVTYEEGWGGGIKDPAAFDAGKEIKVTLKSGVEEITLATGQKQYVKYTDDGSTDENGKRQGFIAAVHPGWYEKDTAPSSWAANQGMTWFMLKMFCVDKWIGNDYKIQIKDSKDKIDEMVYKPLEGKLGQFFPEGKRTEYFCYPFDAYSEVTHDSIEAYDYVTARGGAKSGLPMPGDFFHPYRLDFDAFYMVDKDHATMFPKNKHSLMTLQGMVDSIISHKGYMIRELHAVSRNPFETINDNSVGGWWGAITTDLYDRHLKYCTEKIKTNELVTFNASEIIKYRMTGNAVTGANMTKKSDTEYSLKVQADDIKDKYKDEISVIVKFDRGTEKVDVEYANGDNSYRMPRKLNSDGSAWAVNVNPYKGEALIKLDTEWDGPIADTADANIGGTAVTELASKPVSLFKGIENGKIQFNLPAGEYKVDIISMKGQLVRRSSLMSSGEGSLSSANIGKLAAGVFVFNVYNASGSVMTDKMVIR